MILLDTESDTKRFAEALSTHLHSVDCLTLTGTLGAGKTTLMRYLIQALSEETGTVLSPSFMLVQEYDVRVQSSVVSGQLGNPQTEQAPQQNKTKLYHLDGYRINHPSEIPELGLEEMLESGIVAIEWPEVFADYLPKNRLEITIELLENQQRCVILTGKGRHDITASQLNQEFGTRG